MQQSMVSISSVQPLTRQDRYAPLPSNIEITTPILRFNRMTSYNWSSIWVTRTCKNCNSLNLGATICCGCGRVIAHIKDQHAICSSCNSETPLPAGRCNGCGQPITFTAATPSLRPLPCDTCLTKNLPGAERCQTCNRELLPRWNRAEKKQSESEAIDGMLRRTRKMMDLVGAASDGLPKEKLPLYFSEGRWKKRQTL